MTQSDFEKVYEQSYTKALNAARKVSREHAEDGVADAVVYLLENLARFDRITPSYFTQLAVNRTRNRIGRQHYDVVLPVGSWHDLDLVERADAMARLGRVYNPANKKGRDAGSVVVRLNDEPPGCCREGK